MKYHESSKKIKERAERCLKEMEDAFSERDWNLTIRRAQEAVELFQKALLKYMTIEFPKVHDPAPLLLEKISKMGVKFLAEEKEKFLFISSDLSKKRAPAFYQEEEYSRDEASEAKENALWIKSVFEKYWGGLYE
jgi:HEPN domain-containing protein